MCSASHRNLEGDTLRALPNPPGGFNLAMNLNYLCFLVLSYFHTLFAPLRERAGSLQTKLNAPNPYNLTPKHDALLLVFCSPSPACAAVPRPDATFNQPPPSLSHFSPALSSGTAAAGAIFRRSELIPLQPSGFKFRPFMFTGI